MSRQMPGVGAQVGPMRPDWGDEYADLQCDACDAEWVGPVGESCGWCARYLDMLRIEQSRILLSPDLPDVADERFEVAAISWGRRLKVAESAGIINRQQAKFAWEKHARRAA